MNFYIAFRKIKDFTQFGPQHMAEFLVALEMGRSELKSNIEKGMTLDECYPKGMSGRMSIIFDEVWWQELAIKAMNDGLTFEEWRESRPTGLVVETAMRVWLEVMCCTGHEQSMTYNEWWNSNEAEPLVRNNKYMTRDIWAAAAEAVNVIGTITVEEWVTAAEAVEANDTITVEEAEKAENENLVIQAMAADQLEIARLEIAKTEAEVKLGIARLEQERVREEMRAEVEAQVREEMQASVREETKAKINPALIGVVVVFLGLILVWVQIMVLQ